MLKTKAFATKLPIPLTQKLDEVCEKLGLRKNYVVETALSEKLEDILDTFDLQEAIHEATGFHTWESVKAEWKGKKRS